MIFTRVGFLALLGWAGHAGVSAAQERPAAVLYREVVYFSLDKLAECVKGTVSLPPLAREVKLKTKDKEWEFTNVGLRLKSPGGKELSLQHPLLVLEGKHYFPLEECAQAFGYIVAPQGKDRVLLTIGAKGLVLQPIPIGSVHYRHKVDKLEPVHEFVLVQEPLSGLRTLHRKEDRSDIPAGTTLLVRRKVVFDGVAHVIAGDCGASLDSFLIPEKDLRQKTKPGSGADTILSQYRKWFIEEGKQAAALRRGEPKRLANTVAVTVDLCTSLRQYEAKLFQTLKQFAAQSKKKVHPVMFVSGRWLDQHPVEMHQLIQLSMEPNIEMIWGHHSWDHPKSGGFMNDYPPPQFREDTLRLERRYLEWGVAPTVYYRFPGLIHDRVHLREILDLDLFPIDCDSWMALVKQKDRGPFYYRVRDGGILLVHGNGNEPAGIPALQRWLEEHNDWELGHLNRFLLPKK